MIGPQLQQAIYAELTDTPTLVGGRVYDRVPDGADFPYVTIGEDQTLDDGDTCSDSWEVFTDVHVWSRAVGFPEAKALAAGVVPRVLSIDTVTGFDVISAQVENQRAFRESDGLTNHVVISFRFLLSPT